MASHVTAGLLVCNVRGGAASIPAEGIAEPVSPITFLCSGGNASAVMPLAFTVTLNAPITNRWVKSAMIDPVVTLIGADASTILPVTAQLNGNSIAFSVSVPLSSAGAAHLEISNIRIDATAAPGTVQATVSMYTDGAALVNAGAFAVGTPRASWAAYSLPALHCDVDCQQIPPDPQHVNGLFTGLLPFSATRVSERFPSAFLQAGVGRNQWSDSGDRFLFTYSGFPAEAAVYVPKVIAGYDATYPTTAGGFDNAQSGGSYLQTGAGSLLLALVSGADSNGVGGAPVITAADLGPGDVSLNDAVQIPVVSGNATFVYEVIDSNPKLASSAEFPIFLALPRTKIPPRNPITASVTVNRAPLATGQEFPETAPLPRFSAKAPDSDCLLWGDCHPILNGISGFSRLSNTAVTGSVPTVSGTALGDNRATKSTPTLLIGYASGQPTGWLSASVKPDDQGLSLGLTWDPSKLAPGTYNANVLTYSGRPTGSGMTSVVFTVTSQSAPPPPYAGAVTSAADFFLKTVSPGSLATVFGTGFAGGNVEVALSGASAKIFFANDTQINFQVPPSLAGAASAQTVVTVDGRDSEPVNTPLAAFAPGVFQGGVLNEDSSLNTAQRPAAPHSTLQIFATGIADPSSVTVRLAAGAPLAPSFAGAAPGLTGVQQFNVQLPAGQPEGTTALSLCDASGERCSAPLDVYVGQ
ncbi:MAG TPA: IPT/TIG domain-containing protein [Bryobacteraceae bacterium]|nr:IPT/TIG domain-containing protein [Bryobacteraceae bacterium]